MDTHQVKRERKTASKLLMSAGVYLKIRLLPVDAHQEERERKTASDLPMSAGVYLKPVILMSYIACVRKVHAKKDFMWPADKKNSAFLRKVHPEKE